MKKNEKNLVVTVVVSRRIKKGTEELFESLSNELTNTAVGFEGYMGAVMMRPSSHDDPEYRIIYKFDNQSNLDAWIYSDIRLALLQKIESLLEGPSEIEITSGIATWLNMSEKNRASSPKKYKITIVSWLALYPLITGIFIVFGDMLSTVPLLVRTFIVTAVAMVIMSYILMPRFTKWFSFWLFPKEKEKLR